MLDVKTEFLFDLKADLDWAGVVDVGTTPHGTRSIVYVTGGTVKGPKVKGVVLPGGGDWPVARPDGATADFDGRGCRPFRILLPHNPGIRDCI